VSSVLADQIFWKYYLNFIDQNLTESSVERKRPNIETAEVTRAIGSEVKQPIINAKLES